MGQAKTGLVVAAAFLGAALSVGGTQGGRAPGEAPAMFLATGGCTANTNDVAWVLTTDVFEDPKSKQRVERKVLLCYRVAPNGQFTDIIDVRDITWDAKYKQLPIGGHKSDFTPDKMRQYWEKTRPKPEEE